jgi:hypothetical protein
VRISDLPVLIETVGLSDVTASSLLEALTTRSGGQTITGQALLDLSYRTAGLEPAAAVIEAQETSQVGLRWGRVTWSGFIQASPSFLRTERLVPERLKAAPAHYGLFAEGDWVSSVLTELILDFGPFLLFLPAIVIGVVLSLIDRVLLWLGTLPWIQGLLVLRLAWLLSLVLFEVSLADRTLMFFKGTVGYAGLLLLVGMCARIRVTGRPPAKDVEGVSTSAEPQP